MLFSVMVAFLTIVGFVLMFVCFLLGLFLAAFDFPGVFVIALGYLAYGLLSEDLSWLVFVVVVALAVFAEVLEWVISLYAGKKFGSSSVGLVGAVIGGIVGAIVGVPLFLIGSVVGMFLGSFLGAFLFDLFVSKNISKSLMAAIGIFIGGVGGILLKVIIAVICIVIVLVHVF